MPKPNKDNGCISLSRGVRTQLKSIGRKGETYDDVIRNLIEKKSCANPESPDEEEI